jgi:hypothetical protein
MKRPLPLKDLEDLIFEGGFPSKKGLEEFCIAVGVFHDRKSNVKTDIPGSFDPSRYSIWPLLQVIVHDMEPDIEGMDEMRGELYPFLLGGADMVKERVQGSNGLEALKALSGLIPP